MLLVNKARERGETIDDDNMFDSNCITPGTEFMDRLCGTLKTLRSEGLQWTVSGVDEPGEGEHKVMQAIRSCKTKKSHVIYGLDADLILLSLLQPVEELWLFREAMEAGSVAYTEFNEEKYSYFSIHLLRNTICSENSVSDYLLDYCMAMSFVGNDFLPHGLSIKLKDGGHDHLLKMVDDVRTAVGSFFQKDGATYSWKLEAVQLCVKWLATREANWIQQHCTKKVLQRNQQARGTTPVEIAVDEWNKLPLRICDELALVGSVKRDAQTHRLDVTLSESWRDIYNDRYLGMKSDLEPGRPCKEFLVGLDWILQYYTGQSVDREWCFPWFIPPLMSDVDTWLSREGCLPLAAKSGSFQLQPQQQLALVLPLESWWLIRDRKLRELPRLAPQLWPSSFELFTAGHTQTWECEAKIPLFMPERLRYYLTEGSV
jgi:5'-3' exoribonuclease 1